jgi:hypothetical protein
MAYRYCEECDTWYKTYDYTVNESGETVCRKDGHGAVVGFIEPSRHRSNTVEIPRGVKSVAKSAARRQDLL